MRRVIMLASACGGVWAALRVVEEFARRAGATPDFQVTSEAVPLLIPAGMVGALVGILLGGILFPPRR